MSWVKLDDQAPRNEKMLKAGPAACWLWVCGIAHSQSQLTDGFISLTVLPMIGVQGTPRVIKERAEKLVEARLFDRVEGGYRVHDYLDHNPSRAVVLTKRAEDSSRKKRAESDRTPNGIGAESGRSPEVPARAAHPIPSHPIRSDPIRTTPYARRRRTRVVKWPIFKGQRLTVFEWMLDDLEKLLGSHVDAFDLHAWFFELDARTTVEGVRDSAARWRRLAPRGDARGSAAARVTDRDQYPADCGR